MRGFFYTPNIMNNIILFDDDQWKALLPLCMTRPIGELRIGILTIREKWESYLQGQASYITQDYLSKKYPIKISNDNLVINARWLPNQKLISLIKKLELNDALLYDDHLVASRMDDHQFQRLIDNEELEELKGVDLATTGRNFSIIKRPYDIVKYNADELERDFHMLCHTRKSAPIPANVMTSGNHPIFIEEGANLKFCTLNSENGPIYIGKNTEIMEGSHIRGPFSLSDDSKIKMGATIYGNTSIGPWCKIGGEVSNSVIQGYSNKAHGGYLGNSVLGEWCNLGAGTNVSNLKNNYTTVKLWNYVSEKFEKSDTQFCGIIMGDHSKCGINTMFNTGTVIGASANIFGSGYPRNFIPSFSWGGAKGFKSYTLSKAFETADIVMKRRASSLEDQDKIILEHIFHASASYRSWEK